MLLQKSLLTFLLALAVVHIVQCIPLKTKNRHVNSKVVVKNDKQNQSFVNRKLYPKSNDIRYGKAIKQRVSPIQVMSNVTYDGQHIVNLIAKAKATKGRHTIKEHALMLNKSEADKSGSLVDIDVFRRLLYLQALRRDGINFNNLGQPLIDNTVDILNRMKLGSQYPKLAFEILDGQSLLDIMSAYQPTKQQLSPHDNKVHDNSEMPPAIKANKRQNKEFPMSDPMSSLHSIDGGQNSKLNSPNENNFQYPLDQSENMIVDNSIGKPMKKPGRNLLDVEYTAPVLDQTDVINNNGSGVQEQGVSINQGVNDNHGSVETGSQVFLQTTTSNLVTDTNILDQKSVNDTPNPNRSLVVTRMQDQSPNVPDTQSSLPKVTNQIVQVFETGNQGATVADTKHTISAGKILTPTPVDTSLPSAVFPETSENADPAVIGDTDFLLRTEIENFLKNTSTLMRGKLATQIDAPTNTVSLTATPTRLASISPDPSSVNQSTPFVTDQATKYQSLPTTQENLTTNRVTTTVAFDWCTFLCNVMKRCSPACSGHFTSWNR